MPGLTKQQIKQYRKLSEEEQIEYLRLRLHDEAEDWLEYFLRSGDHLGRLRDNFLTRPSQR